MQTFELWALSALAFLFAALSIISLISLKKTKRVHKQCFYRLCSQEKELINALCDRVEAIIQVMDVASLSGHNANLLYSKMEYYIGAKDKKRSLAKNMATVANLIFYGLVDYLKSNYPKLTQHDLEICSLIALGFPAHSIENMYKYTNTNSYYNRRARIRKKIDGCDSSNLEPILFAIIKQLKREREKEIKDFEIIITKI